MLHAQRTLPFTIIRPPIVQGPHDASLRGWFWYQRVADGGAGNRAAFGKTYNVASEEILSLDDFVRLTASILGVRDPVVTVAEDRLARDAPWYTPTYVHRFVMDISRITSDLGFAPTPYASWLDETIRWHITASLPASAGYDHRAEEVALATPR